MRPIEFMSGQPATSVPEASISSFEQAIAQFLAVSAYYLSLPAERLAQLTQHK